MSLKAQAEQWLERLEARRPRLPLKPDGPADKATD